MIHALAIHTCCPKCAIGTTSHFLRCTDCSLGEKRKWALKGIEHQSLSTKVRLNLRRRFADDCHEGAEDTPVKEPKEGILIDAGKILSAVSRALSAQRQRQRLAQALMLTLAVFTMVLLSFIPFHYAKAGERYEFYNGVRSLGMGGASVAVVNDETALLTNPAALGKLRNYFVTVIDPEMDINEETHRIVELNIADFMSPQKTLDNVKAFPGRRLHQRAQLFPSFVVTNFGFGVYGRYSADAFTDDAATTYTYEYRNDYAFVFGFNFRLFDGRIKLGVNARGVNRVEAKRTDIPLASTGLTFESMIGSTTLASEGFGVGTDVGLILTGPWKFLPSIAAVYRDVGTTSYTVNKGMFYSTTERPERTPATLDVGLSISPILKKNTRMSFTVEMVDVMDQLEPTTLEASDEAMRRIHGGIEFNFGDVFFIRGGMNQGYWTAGAEIAVGNTQLQIASYGEEVSDVIPKGSTATYTAEEDRRYVAKFSYRF